ncbi:hypothetical protein [Shewanella sp. YLB-07]|uniref:hypothetical protein n=1 Tax=Shewanella sp. YLB-07 TaxID=2601268 RepID=UPI00128C4046|nr:hypothetical protein [Shewanella sp. YLB-07]MPY25003.1 hypothetical protein [Shewanella sp. YLB-07]
MTDSCANVNQLIIDIYLNDSSSIPDYTKALNINARIILDHTKIISNLHQAYLLRELIDEEQKQINQKHDPMRAQLLTYIMLIGDCFDAITDDLLLLSAFETHAKSELLHQGFIIHTLIKPKEIARQQQNKPVSIKTIREANQRNESVKFTKYENTLSVSKLLQPKYLEKFNLTPSEVQGVEEVRKRRNTVHFQLGSSYRVSSDLLNFVSFLDASLPKSK